VTNADSSSAAPRRLTFVVVCEEPFRLFFPLAVVAGLVGTLVWPLHFAGWMTWYPGVNHARILTQGFFGAFMVGFLGTALPRMLSSPRFTGPEVGLLFALHATLIVAHALARTAAGDALFLALLGVLMISLGLRVLQREDVPPPGFVLVGLAFLCGAGGTVLALMQERLEDRFFWLYLRPLLQFHGFILLPILGVGGFILPRFFGLPNRHDFPESRTPPPGWTRQALWALVVGVAILVTFVIEAKGMPRLGSGLRFLVSAGYLYWQVPFFRSTVRKSSLAFALRIALLLLPVGFLAVAVFPMHRVALLHVTLVGGFSVLTLCVATRVVFGHSGQPAAFTARLRWLTVAVVLMLAGMVTRISGDYWPKILVTHYSYGAVLWAAGLLLWGIRVLPSVRRSDPD
jgi:uncharacterized protein involved in response to NO